MSLGQAAPGFLLILHSGSLLILHSGSPVCPRDKPSLSQGQTQFVPEPSWGRRAAEKVYLLKVYVPFLLAKQVSLFGCMVLWAGFLSQDRKQGSLGKGKSCRFKNVNFLKLVETLEIQEGPRSVENPTILENSFRGVKSRESILCHQFVEIPQKTPSV